ncbi:MAG: hypothetical protein ACPGEG_09065, partial [Salibacteraceae bacterium]
MNLIKLLKATLLTLIMTLSLSTAFSQGSLDGMKYQGIIRNASGQVVGGKNITLKFIIYQKGGTPAVYEEEHATRTNTLGLVNLEIGINSTIISGDFTTIDWAAGVSNPYYILVELDLNDGNGYIAMGESKLLTTPYAQYARTAETATDDGDRDASNELQTLSISNDTVFLSDNGGYFVLPASVQNLDNDSTNELNTTVVLSGTDLNVTDAGGTKTADLSSLEESQAIIDSAAAIRADFPVLVINNDNDSTNELIDTTFLVNNTVLIIENGDTNRIDLNSLSLPANGIDSVLMAGSNANGDSIVFLGYLGLDTNVAIDNEKLTIRSPDQQWNFISTNGDVEMGFWLYSANGGGGQLGTRSNHPLEFIVKNGAPSMKIDTSGIVTIYKSLIVDERIGVGHSNPWAKFNAWNTETNTTTNVAVAGEATGNTTGQNFGVWGKADSSSVANLGVYGRAEYVNPNSVNIGAQGDGSYGNQNFGVRGFAKGNSSSVLVYGVYGQADSSGSVKRGVVGRLLGAVENDDAAVYGSAEGQGTNIAVYGVATNTNNTTDTNIAVVGQAANAMVNIAGWFKEGNVYVDDTLILQRGAQTNYVLTSDADGRAEWKPASQASNNDNDSTNELITSITWNSDFLVIDEGGSKDSISFLGFVDTTTFNNYKALVANNLLDSMNVLRSEMAADTSRIFNLEQLVNDTSDYFMNRLANLSDSAATSFGTITADSIRINTLEAGAYLDSSTTNEIQALSISNDTIYLS